MFLCFSGTEQVILKLLSMEPDSQLFISLHFDVWLDGHHYHLFSAYAANI